MDEGSALTGTKWTFKPRFAHGKWYFQHSSFRMKAPGSQQIGGRNCPAQSTITSSFDKAFSIRALRSGSCAGTIPLPCSLSHVCTGNVERRQVTLLLVLSATKTKGFGSELEWWGGKDSDGMMDRCDITSICWGSIWRVTRPLSALLRLSSGPGNGRHICIRDTSYGRDSVWRKGGVLKGKDRVITARKVSSAPGKAGFLGGEGGPSEEVIYFSSADGNWRMLGRVPVV